MIRMRVGLAVAGGLVLGLAARAEETGLVGRWTLDEGSGLTAADSSGGGHDGTLTNMDPATDWVAGKVGAYALDFDGTDDHVETGVTASGFGVYGGHAKAVSAWVYTRSFNDGGVFELGAPATNENFSLRTTGTTDNWRVQLWGGADLDLYYPSVNSWVHFVVSYDGGRVEVWADGTPIASKQVGLWTTDGKSFRIGRWDWGWNPGESRFFDGMIDEVRLYDRELSEAEILNLYYAGAGSAAPSITTSAPTKAGVGFLCQYRVEAAGNPLPSIAVAGLPTWLVFDGTDTISGTPGAGDVGTTGTITATASNGVSPDAVQEFTITVSEADPSLVGRWKLDEAEGTTAADSVGTNHGTVYGTPVWQPTGGQVDGALELSGDDEVEIDRTVKNDFTIAFWMKTSTSGASGGAWQWWQGTGLVDAEVAGSTGDFGVVLFGDRVAFGVGNPDVTIFSDLTVTDGFWHQVAATRVRSSGEIRLYVDGHLQDAASAGTHALSAPAEVVFGAIRTGYNYYVGLLDDVRIHDRALSAEDVWAASGCGIHGTYFDNADLTDPVVDRVDANVDFDWGWGSPDPAVPVDHFSVRWTGEIEPPAGGTYTFTTVADDGVRLWVAGRLIIDDWNSHAATANSGEVTLTGGERHSVRLEYFDDYASASVELRWSGPGVAEQVVPPCVLVPTYIVPPAILSARSYENATTVKVTFTEALNQVTAETSTNYTLSGDGSVTGASLDPDAKTVTLATTALAPETVHTVYISGVEDLDGNAVVAGTAADFAQVGYQGVYYPNQDLTSPAVERVDATVNFNWGGGSPAAGIGTDHFSAMWLGRVVPRYSEDYIFYTLTDDGVRLWVGGELVIDQWRDQAATEYSATVPLTAGGKYDVVMLYYEYTGPASASLSWSSASQAKEVIPQARVWTHAYADSTPPDAPADLAADVDGNAISLAWTVPTDDFGVAGYEVFRDGVKLGVTCEPAWMDDALKYSTSYTYAVTAFDFGANVSAAAELVVETSGPPFIGTGTGLAGVYYDNMDFTGATVERTDATVDFDWGTAEPAPGIGADTFSVRWTGKVQAQVAETYTFYTQTDDGVRLWVGGRLVVDAWYDQGVTEHSGTITLLAGEKYSVKIEYYENGGLAAARLLWESTSIPKAVIPESQLYPEVDVPSVAVSSPLTSATSPVWVEGDVTASAASVWVSVAGAGAFEAVRENATRWYADDPAAAGALGIPLTQGAPSAFLSIESRAEGGGVIQTTSCTITWTVTDLAGKSASTDSIVIRKGDSLLLTATGTGALTIHIDGTLEFSGTAGQTFGAAFATSGVFTIVAKIDGADVGSLMVKVVDVAAAPPIGVWMGYERLKTLQVSPTGVLGPPPDIIFVPSDFAMLDVAVDSSGADSVTLALNAYATGTTSLQARIGGAEGPVVLDQEVHEFNLTYLTPLVAPTFLVYSDGDVLAGNALRMEPYYPGHRIRCYIFAGGALFEETGTTEYVMDTSDFDANGEFLYYLVTPGIICHGMEVADEE